MRTFSLGAVLSVSTGCFVAREGFGAVHELLDYMTGDTLFTHQLPRVMGECQPAMLAQHPQLKGIEVPDFGEIGSREEAEATVFAWLSTVEAEYGTELPVVPMAAVDHTSIDPLSELGLMGVGPERTLVVNPDDFGGDR